MENEKFKKIRGENRLLKSIENWKVLNEPLDINYLKNQKHDYVKFRVDPWSRILFTKINYPEPNGIFREKIIEGFVEIYKSWKTEIEKSDIEEYYLKLWIMFPNFRDSRLVCGINEKIDWYENLFFENEKELDFPNEKFEKNSNLLLSEFNWDNFSDKQIFDEDFVGTENEYRSKKNYQKSKKEFEDFLNTNPENEIFKDENGNDIKYYYKKINEVWVGELKTNN
jgi:hypothetical protein